MFFSLSTTCTGFIPQLDRIQFIYDRKATRSFRSCLFYRKKSFLWKPSHSSAVEARQPRSVRSRRKGACFCLFGSPPPAFGLCTTDRSPKKACSKFREKEAATLLPLWPRKALSLHDRFFYASFSTTFYRFSRLKPFTLEALLPNL